MSYYLSGSGRNYVGEGTGAGRSQFNSARDYQVMSTLPWSNYPLKFNPTDRLPLSHIPLRNNYLYTCLQQFRGSPNPNVHSSLLPPPGAMRSDYIIW